MVGTEARGTKSFALINNFTMAGLAAFAKATACQGSLTRRAGAKRRWDPATYYPRGCGRKGLTRSRGGRREKEELRELRVSA